MTSSGETLTSQKRGGAVSRRPATRRHGNSGGGPKSAAGARTGRVDSVQVFLRPGSFPAPGCPHSRGPPVVPQAGQPTHPGAAAARRLSRGVTRCRKAAGASAPAPPSVTSRCAPQGRPRLHAVGAGPSPRRWRRKRRSRRRRCETGAGQAPARRGSAPTCGGRRRRAGSGSGDPSGRRSQSRSANRVRAGSAQRCWGARAAQSGRGATAAAEAVRVTTRAPSLAAADTRPGPAAPPPRTPRPSTHMSRRLLRPRTSTPRSSGPLDLRRPQVWTCSCEALHSRLHPSRRPQLPLQPSDPHTVGTKY